MSTVSASMDAVSEAARSFESRWSFRALRRVDRELHNLFQEALDEWHEILVTGKESDIKEVGEEVVRGYAAITKRMTDAGAEHDAYMRGRCPRTGTEIIVSPNKAVEDFGVISITPDEVASIVGGIEAIKRCKELFPGAEVVDILNRTEPAIDD